MAGISVPLTGLSANDPEPGVYIEVNFAQGPVSGASGLRAILLLGNATTAGSATKDTVIYGPPGVVGTTAVAPLATLQDWITLFGQGSELHRMARRILKFNTSTPLYAVAVTESAGANATLAITFATTATAVGTARVFIMDEFIDTQINSGDTAIVIAGNVAAAINTKFDWPVTAANGGTAVVTVTAKNKGLRGNWLRGSAAIITTGTIATTVTPLPTTAFTGGTTADSNVTALATILGTRFYYIVSAAEDSTQLGALVSQVGTQALPITGLRQTVFGASVDTPGNAITIANAVNSARCELQWLQDADWTPAELAANWAGIEALTEANLSAQSLNLNQYGTTSTQAAIWNVRAPRKGTTNTRTQRVSALNNGVSPITVLAGGATIMDKRVTTRTGAAFNDYRIRDPHKVRVDDFFGDDWAAKCQAQFGGKTIADDPVPGQRIPGAGTVSARQIKAAGYKLIDDYADKFLFQQPDAIKAGLIVNREPGTTSRISCRFPTTPSDILDQIASAIDQLS